MRMRPYRGWGPTEHSSLVIQTVPCVLFVARPFLSIEGLRRQTGPEPLLKDR